MGFPGEYPEVHVPNIFIYILSFIAFLRSIAILFISILDTYFSSASSPESQLHRPTLSEILIREFLPVVSFSDLDGDSPPAAVGCALCLNDFAGEEEIRCMANCRHIFHRTCVDGWINRDQKTCPLCRTHFVPYHKMEDYNQRVCIASQSQE
ncbi:E3 ubiquitin-protein ligase rha1b-like protein [Trifolium pratense]|uniref:E3 ubiquitin-protein ligase rha1b-like protein n=2 Tax=Trifolium pratense TaxID=57577 RepID=A0A2K3PD68_TRIPR|nr:E3 ubiquitin-protein ligase rha1b-like protein [Trifolium pratense]CAJ2671259.1 unnamed protein product [Trifolium pratense]